MVAVLKSISKRSKPMLHRIQQNYPCRPDDFEPCPLLLCIYTIISAATIGFDMPPPKKDIPPPKTKDVRPKKPLMVRHVRLLKLREFTQH